MRNSEAAIAPSLRGILRGCSEINTLILNRKICIFCGFMRCNPRVFYDSKKRFNRLSDTRVTSPTKKGKSLSPSSTNWNPIPSEAYEKVIFANA